MDMADDADVIKSADPKVAILSVLTPEYFAVHSAVISTISLDIRKTASIAESGLLMEPISFPLAYMLAGIGLVILTFLNSPDKSYSVKEPSITTILSILFVTPYNVRSI